VRWGEVKRRLKRLGVELEEERKRHELWRSSRNGRYALVPRHDQQEAPSGTLAAILRELGISRDEFTR
jgi:predicted RNA binding protein YcfA (HicA-like mRNA interferase family)